MESVDCVVVGTGLYGLGVAKQFRELNPNSSLVILEKNGSVGGTWSDERLYPGVKTNNLHGTYNYPDYPMTPERFGIQPKEYVPGTVVNDYFKSYASHFGIADLVRFHSSVSVAEHVDQGGWNLTVYNSATAKDTQIYTRRLILATGLTSEAFIPHFKGQESFGGPVFHGKDFLKHADTVRQGKTVTVFGATKLSFDAVYEYATSGATVNWVIRESGHGPCWISSSWVTPFKRWIEELANTRFLTWMSPCIWGDNDGYKRIREFLHGTALGRAIVNTYWKVLGGDVITANNYDAHPNTAKLKPWTEAMFTGASFSILNYPTDFWAVVRGSNVHVHTGEFSHMSPGQVHLVDGTTLQSDAFLAHTGWKHVPPMKFLPEGIERELGIPHEPLEAPDARDLASQKSLFARADEDILARFPRLKTQPVWNKNYVPMTDRKGIDSTDKATPYTQLTPYMLYHFLVPASEHFLETRDIAFAGMLGNFSNPINAHVQGLWISAYFNEQLVNDPGAAVGDVKAMERVKYETVLHSRFGKWRYPTCWGSNKAPSFIFDAVPYLDMLQRDLGLPIHRKGSWLYEMWCPYLPLDYENVNEEWRKLHN